MYCGQPGLISRAVNHDSIFAYGLKRYSKDEYEKMLEEFKKSPSRYISGSCIRDIEIVSNGLLVKVVYERDNGELISPPDYKQITDLPEFIRNRKSLLKQLGPAQRSNKAATDADEEAKLAGEINAMIDKRSRDLENQTAILNSIQKRHKEVKDNLHMEAKSAEQLLNGGRCADKECSVRNIHNPNHLRLHTESQKLILDELRDLNAKDTAVQQEKKKIESEITALKQQIKMLKGD
jgi:hypothetical protein